MKNYFLLAILLITSLGFAQNVNFGVRGGLNLADANWEVSGGGASISFDTDFRPSVYFGGFAEFGLKDSSHKLQAGLTYYVNGTKFSEEGEDFTFKISQLNVPVLFKFSAAEGLYLNGGVYAGAIIDVEAEDGSESVDLTDGFKTFDFGLSIGAEYNFSNGLFLEARYNYGLVNVWDIVEGIDIEGADVEFQNRFLTFGLGYKF